MMLRRFFALGLPLLAAAGGSRAPTAAPVPTPPPATPKATLPGPMIGCEQPQMPDLHNQCPHTSPVFASQVEVAVKRVFDLHPDLFDFNDKKGDGLYSYKVLDRRQYTSYVVEGLPGQKLCAVVGLEEIAGKPTNDFNQQYDVWASDGYVRLPHGAFITTCTPAQF